MRGINEMRDKMPLLLAWIEQAKRDWADRATSVAELRRPALEAVYPSWVLERTKSVVTSGDFPFPPMEELGFPELAYWKRLDLIGVTYGDHIFLKEGKATDSLYFHEMVHVVQGATLGVGPYLLAYGASLAADSYEGNPFEATAYALQAEFEAGALREDAVPRIQAEARAGLARFEAGLA